MKYKIRTNNLTGERGLFIAVIVRAEADIAAGNEHADDALDYFKSDNYRCDMRLLGLDPDLLPERVRDCV